MKKYVITQSIGTWSYKDGRQALDCNLLDEIFVADGNDWEELWNKYCLLGGRSITYLDRGIWRGLNIYKQRSEAKYMLEYYAKQNGRA